ncbi:DNAj domain protein [Chytriomyces hyalinus]|nr:DNAj domain protein [Chytriomyces hyalinus]
MDLYAILGVSSDADTESIKAAYHLLARKYHPDKNKQANAKERFQTITAAYTILSSESERKKYNGTRAAEKDARETFRDPYDVLFGNSFRNFPSASSKPKMHKPSFSTSTTSHDHADPTPQPSTPIPPSFFSTATPESTQNATFWSTAAMDSTDTKPTEITATLEQLFNSAAITVSIPRITYSLAPQRSNQPYPLYTPITTNHPITVQLHSLKHTDGCIITVPEAGDQLHPSIAAKQPHIGQSLKPRQRDTKQFHDLRLVLRVLPHDVFTRVLVNGKVSEDLEATLFVTAEQARDRCRGVTLLGIDGRVVDCSSGNGVPTDSSTIVVKGGGWVKADQSASRGNLILHLNVQDGSIKQDNSHTEDGSDHETSDPPKKRKVPAEFMQDCKRTKLAESSSN